MTSIIYRDLGHSGLAQEESGKNMTETFQYDVFISHSAKDKPVVRELAERLFEGFGPQRGPERVAPGRASAEPGESGISIEPARNAGDRGARHVTHLYDAAYQVLARNAGRRE